MKTWEVEVHLGSGGDTDSIATYLVYAVDEGDAEDVTLGASRHLINVTANLIRNPGPSTRWTTTASSCPTRCVASDQWSGSGGRRRPRAHDRPARRQRVRARRSEAPDVPRSNVRRVGCAGLTCCMEGVPGAPSTERNQPPPSSQS